MTGEQVREWRWQHHLTQDQLAELLDVRVLTIRRWEGGYTVPPGFLRLALERLDHLLAVQPEETPA